ncbi:hypothetical protein EVAR_65681_1 [Eumeta japonica]|uniref:V-type proton ATPase subunit a n=1 Tax=Eumeta variegata TaxID=151549 RepID=A0A4C1ZKK7_EUMVA|nr:hypothetical protein EVAR_65681_1 [Eumeta japonica]
MGDMFRSKAMTFCDIFLQPEAAYDILAELGEMSNVQFIDSNPELSAFQRMYVTEVRRCEEMERKLRFMHSEMVKDKIHTPKNFKIPRAPHPRDMAIYEIGPLIGDVELNRGNLLRIYGNERRAGVLKLYSGVIRRDKSYAFETMMWRVSRGNIFLRLAENDELLENAETLVTSFGENQANSELTILQAVWAYTSLGTEMHNIR